MDTFGASYGLHGLGHFKATWHDYLQSKQESIESDPIDSRTDVSDTTTYTYHPDTDPVLGNRGNIKDITNPLGHKTTFDTYDGNGRVTQMTAPDGSVLTYGYDPAHRLTSVTDSLGNKVTYTLDAIGNRISEKATDPGNVLRRNITRVYDALNRLQTVTGGVQ
jgi:YD repeat-containing protein